jgi:hypothetical protein
MKKIIFVLTIILSSTISFSQIVEKNASTNSENSQTHFEPVFRLFPTQNMWTFIKLNTRNGRMWQVQFDVQGSNRFETFLNLLRLVEQDKEENGRFTLYPTQNIYTFILLDQIDGKMWQVQWAMEPENRGILPIE